MAKRIISALFIIIVFSVIVAFFVSFGMAQAPDGHAVELQLNQGWCNDLGPSPPNPESLDPPDFVKDVAWCSGEVLDDPFEVPHDLETDIFEFTIHNGYPGYECTFNVTVHNADMEPLEITSVSVTSTSPGEISVSGVSVSPTSQLAPNGLPGDSAVVIFTVTVLEGATPGTTYLNVIDGSIVVDGEDNG